MPVKRYVSSRNGTVVRRITQTNQAGVGNGLGISIDPGRALYDSQPRPLQLLEGHG
jgi:hypothetical protein